MIASYHTCMIIPLTEALILTMAALRFVDVSEEE